MNHEVKNVLKLLARLRLPANIGLYYQKGICLQALTTYFLFQKTFAKPFGNVLKHQYVCILCLLICRWPILN